MSYQHYQEKQYLNHDIHPQHLQIFDKGPQNASGSTMTESTNQLSNRGTLPPALPHQMTFDQREATDGRKKGNITHRDLVHSNLGQTQDIATPKTPRLYG